MNLTDHTKLPSVVISKPGTSIPFIPVTNKASYQWLETLADSIIEGSETAALLIIRNDSLLYEKYFMGFNENSLLPSNSMAKSYTGTLLAIAIAEGKIGSIHDPVTKYLPSLSLRDNRFHNITLQHLLDMRSGLDFNEGSYTLWDDAMQLGLKKNLSKNILKVDIAEPPGKFKYQSINTQLLGLVVQRATGIPLQLYLQKKLWQPIGAESDASWNVDSKKRKQVLMSAGINATSRDFAKLGRLYINNGSVHNTQVLQSSWIQSVASIDTMEKYKGYKFQWWNNKIRELYQVKENAQRKRTRKKHAVIQPLDEGYELKYRIAAYSARGFLNQIIFVHPEKKTIIVRIGRGWKKDSRFIQSIYYLGEQM